MSGPKGKNSQGTQESTWSKFAKGAYKIGSTLYGITAPGMVNKAVKAVAKAVAQPAVSMAEDLVNRNIAVPVQKALGITPDPIVRDESYYMPHFKLKVRNIVEEKLNKEYPNWRERVANGETIKFGISGTRYTEPGHYATSWDYSDSPITRAVKTTGQVANTLGGFSVEAGPNGIRVMDTYDFNKNVKPNTNEWWGWIRENIANKFGSGEEDPDNEKIHTDMLLPYSHKYGGLVFKKYFTR